MPSIKALIFLDKGGNNLVNYFSSEVSKPELMNGFITAINSFVKELLGGSLKELIIDNGLKIKLKTLYLNEQVDYVNLSFSKDLNLDSIVVTARQLGLDLNGYVLASTIPEKPKNYNVKSLTEVISLLDKDSMRIPIYDFNNLNKPLFMLKYTPYIKYQVTDNKTDLPLTYVMIYDSSDELLNGFIKDEFNKLEQVIANNANLFGPALAMSDISMLDLFDEAIKGFVNDYESNRSKLLLEKTPNHKTPELNINDLTVNSMIKALDEIRRIIYH